MEVDRHRLVPLPCLEISEDNQCSVPMGEFDTRQSKDFYMRKDTGPCRGPFAAPSALLGSTAPAQALPVASLATADSFWKTRQL